MRSGTSPIIPARSGRGSSMPRARNNAATRRTLAGLPGGYEARENGSFRVRRRDRDDVRKHRLKSRPPSPIAACGYTISRL